MMCFDPEICHRRSIRLKRYDYAWPGAYFVTVCAHDHKCLFGEIADGKMIQNDAGRIVEKCWQEIPVHFSHVALDEFVVMPNHVHGILMIIDVVGAKNFSPQPLTETLPSAGAENISSKPLSSELLPSMGAKNFSPLPLPNELPLPTKLSSPAGGKFFHPNRCRNGPAHRKRLGRSFAVLKSA